MEYLNRLKEMHKGAADILENVVVTQNEIRFLEEKQKSYSEIYGEPDWSISIDLMGKKRINNRLLHSYKKIIKQINVEI